MAPNQLSERTRLSECEELHKTRQIVISHSINKSNQSVTSEVTDGEQNV